MAYPFVGIVLGLALTLVWFAVVVLADVYGEVSRPVVVPCPSTGLDAAVRLRPMQDRPPLVTNCSRWPGNRSCHQGCIESLPLSNLTAMRSNV